MPARDGLKTPPLTAVPEYVPPAGNPPDRAYDVAEAHWEFSELVQVTVGSAKTWIVLEVVPVQPLPSVYV